MNELEQRQIDEEMELQRRRCEERQQEERQYNHQMEYDQMTAEVARLRAALVSIGDIAPYINDDGRCEVCMEMREIASAALEVTL